MLRTHLFFSRLLIRYCKRQPEKAKRRLKPFSKEQIMGKTAHTAFDCAEGCSVEAALAVIGGKWKGTILYRLHTDGVLRFNEIRRILPTVSQRTLTAQLRALEADGIIERTVYAQVPPRVEYRLSAYGQTLAPVLAALKAWGDAHRQRAARE
ncbi:phage integrase family site-specific recombinase [Neisseria bacilliformis ATCC BAA-1200]|uniref:Phage integrase family site-specific recombinase n=2 Tax=Neisseria TaxID=482 RepID=F2BB63_9NEIS|nr:phage integrase family site-specific recombinase [Neisseria bacilliformis ATCC BAA-1200]